MSANLIYFKIIFHKISIENTYENGNYMLKICKDNYFITGMYVQGNYKCTDYN